MTPGLFIGAFVAGIAEQLSERLVCYSVTNHGHNPWTVTAALNAVRLMPYFERVIKTTNGKITSIYRSPVVNEKVDGSPLSRHQEALAMDFVVEDYEKAGTKLNALAKSKRLGPVRLIFFEQEYRNNKIIRWIHIDWYRVNEEKKDVMVRKLNPDTKKTEAWYV